MSKYDLIEQEFAKMNRKKLERQAADLDRDLLRQTIELERPDPNDLERQHLLEQEEEEDEQQASQDSSELDSHPDEEESQSEMVHRPVINLSLTLMTV